MTVMHIRQLLTNEVDEILNIWKNDKMIDLNSYDDSTEQITCFIKRNNYLCLGVFEGTCLVGCCLASEDGRRGYIYHFCIDKKHRRHGYGTALLKEIVSRISKKGIKKIHVNYFKNNDDAISFWNHCGFVERKELIMSTLTIF